MSIKGDVASEFEEGLAPAFSASGQDVWLPEGSAQFHSPGLILSAVGARCGKVFLSPLAGPWGVVANTSPLLPTERADVRFMYYVVNQPDFWHTGGGAQPYVQVEASLATPVRLFPLHDQRRIADFLDDRVARIDQIIAARQQQIGAAEQAFASLRREEALAGRSRRRVPELPWASDIPSHWPIRRLRQLATMGTGHTPSRSNDEYWGDCTIPWLTTADVHKFRQDQIDSLEMTEFMISALGLANSAAVLHPAGTVALSRTASAGFSIVMDSDMATSQDYVTWTCGPELAPHYLLQLLRIMRPYLLGYLAMGSTHKTIYFPDLMDLLVPTPPRAEQDASVDRIRVAHDAHVQVAHGLAQQITLLQEYKQSLITAAVTGEFDVTTAAPIPE